MATKYQIERYQHRKWHMIETDIASPEDAETAAQGYAAASKEEIRAVRVVTKTIWQSTKRRSC